jgi:hypothetical protein
MIETLTSEASLERVPKILAVSLYRAYPRYAQERIYVPREVFWLAESRIDEQQSVLIRGDIDLEKPRIVDALSTVDVGVISLEEATGMWLRVDDPSRHLTLPKKQKKFDILPAPRIDSYSEMLLEHMAGLGSEDGRLIESRDQLGRIADYLLQTIILDEVGPTDPLPFLGN